MEITVGGVDQLTSAGTRLREAGNGGLQRELLEAISKATKAFPDSARTSARSVLPGRGGLADRVARSNVSIRSQVRAAAVGVTVKVSGEYNLSRLDEGQVRHPVFGRGVVTQRIRDGWLTTPVVAAQKAAAAAVEDAALAVAERIAGR